MGDYKKYTAAPMEIEESLDRAVVVANFELSPVGDDMLSRWCAALDRDEWPEGEYSVGDIIKGRPPSGTE